ncbi:MAG: ABC transporter permease [Planctomycetota bacterium]|nr:ABC transporter permease [Planctomycetota bacterium]
MATDAAILTAAERLAPRPAPRWAKALRNPRTIAALAVILLTLAMALCAPWLAPHGYKDQYRGEENLAPGAYLLGTDDLGRDILSRMMYGAQVSLAVGLCATLVSMLIGVAVGLLSGYFGGWADSVLMRFTDTIAAFPSLLLAMAITAVYDRPHQTMAERIAVLIFALGIVGWTGMARLVRSQVLTIKGEDYVNAARALGAEDRHIILRHVLPNCVSPIIVVATLAIGGNILGEAGLSFLGLGVQAPFPSWGGMLADARNYVDTFWWQAVFPGTAIVITVLAFNLFGDSLRDALDPKALK